MRTKAIIVQGRDVLACPLMSLHAGHYRKDGTCRCDERQAAEAAVGDARQAFNAARAALVEAQRYLESIR